MSTVETRMERSAALEIATSLVAAIDGAYEQLIVAGSIRRLMALIGDIEIVAVPKIVDEPTGLFEDYTQAIDKLHFTLEQMLSGRMVEKRLDVNGSPRWGPTLKYLTYQGARVDLFTPCAERFGWVLLLRTGPAPFSRQLVVNKGKTTKDGRPGLLPPHIQARDGWLTYRTSGERIPTPTERDCFDLFGLPFAEAWERI